MRNLLYSFYLKRFRSLKIEEPGLSIDHIFSKICHQNYGTVRKYLNTSRAQRINSKEINLIKSLCSRRLLHEPIQYIIGDWDFRFFSFKIRKPVLIPRSETEQIVEIAIEKSKKKFGAVCNINFLEIGSGSGVISIALVQILRGTALEPCQRAFKLSRENAAFVLGEKQNLINFHNCKIEDFHAGVLAGKFSAAKYDFIISNPPYIATYKLSSLPRSVRFFESKKALDGGSDGLTIIKEAINASKTLLSETGFLLMETDIDQHDVILGLIKEKEFSHFRHGTSIRDIYGRNRFVLLER